MVRGKGREWKNPKGRKQGFNTIHRRERSNMTDQKKGNFRRERPKETSF